MTFAHLRLFVALSLWLQQVQLLLNDLNHETNFTAEPHGDDRRLVFIVRTVEPDSLKGEYSIAGRQHVTLEDVCYKGIHEFAVHIGSFSRMLEGYCNYCLLPSSSLVLFAATAIELRAFLQTRDELIHHVSQD